MSNKLNDFLTTLYGTDENEKSIIALEVQRLLNILPDTYKDFFPEIEEILFITADYIFESKAENNRTQSMFSITLQVQTNEER